MTNLKSLPVFCAIDTVDLAQAKAWVGVAVKAGFGLKFGKEFFTAHGPAAVRRLRPDGVPLFLDMKFHDIPNTVRGAVRAAVKSVAPTFITVHASGGAAMLRAAVEGADEAVGILAVTVLTSLSVDDLAAQGISEAPDTHVLRLGRLAADNGAAGVIAAAYEIASLRLALPRALQLVIPGIRLSERVKNDDQKRIMGPREALRLGANWLVIGRPITAAPDPAQAAQRIVDLIADHV